MRPPRPKNRGHSPSAVCCHHHDVHGSLTATMYMHRSLNTKARDSFLEYTWCSVSCSKKLVLRRFEPSSEDIDSPNYLNLPVYRGHLPVEGATQSPTVETRLEAVRGGCLNRALLKSAVHLVGSCGIIRVCRQVLLLLTTISKIHLPSVLGLSFHLVREARFCRLQGNRYGRRERVPRVWEGV